MSDEEQEMAKLRQSKKFQSSLHNENQQIKKQQHDDTQEQQQRQERNDAYSKFQFVKDQDAMSFKAPLPKSSKLPKDTQQSLHNQYLERRSQINKDRGGSFLDRQDMEDNSAIDIHDLSDINLAKMRRTNDEPVGEAFLEEKINKGTDIDPRQSYKDFMLKEYYDDLKKKQKLNTTDQSYIPVDLGRQKKQKMSTEETESIHNVHKRVKLSIQHQNKEEFEINVEEDDDEMVGPRLDLFDKNQLPDNSENRARKENQIFKNVSDVLDDDEIDAKIYKMPLSHEVVLASHSRAIQAVDLDFNGIRMISGSADYILKVWDLTTMNKKLKSFREFKPFDGHPIRALSFSPDGNFFLCCCGNSQAKIHNREGQKQQMTIKGDMYISDMSNTKGHVAALTDGQWNPKANNIFMTASMDSTVRLWDLESKTVGVDQQLMQTQVIKSFNAKGQKAPINSINYSKSGILIVGGCNDGSVQVWDTKARSFHRPQILFREAHQLQQEVTSVKWFNDEKRLVSRSMDDTMKLWDIRNVSQPVFEWKDLINLSSKTNICISPDERLVMTGTSVRKGFGYGLMMVYDTQTGLEVDKVGVSQQSVVTIKWHPVINQIIVGSADGSIRYYYDPQLSEKGIMNCVVKQERKRPIDAQTIFTKPIFTPSTYEDEREKEMEKDPFNPNNQNYASSHIAPEVLDPRLMRDKIRHDPIATRKPEMPLQGPLGRGGKRSAGGTISQYIMKNLNKDEHRNVDPREVLLKYAKEAAENPQWIAPAYQQTQPKTIYDTSSLKREGQKFLEDATTKKCAHCGLKFCQCVKKHGQ